MNKSLKILRDARLPLRAFLEMLCYEGQIIAIYYEFSCNVLKSNESIKTTSFINFFERNDLLCELSDKCLNSSNFEFNYAKKNGRLMITLKEDM